MFYQDVLADKMIINSILCFAILRYHIDILHGSNQPWMTSCSIPWGIQSCFWSSTVQKLLCTTAYYLDIHIWRYTFNGNCLFLACTRTNLSWTYIITANKANFCCHVKKCVDSIDQHHKKCRKNYRNICIHHWDFVS